MKIIDIFYYIAFVIGMASICLSLEILIFILLFGYVNLYEPNFFILILELVLLIIALPFLFILAIKYFIGQME